MFSIEQLVEDCLEAVRTEGTGGALAVKEVVARAVADPGAIEQAVGPASDQPLFSTWYNSDELTVLNVIWPPGADLTPHDHKMWAAIGLYGGREDNRFFRVLPDGLLEARGTKMMGERDTVLLGDDTVHQVVNPSKAWTGAIHVYGGDFFIRGRRLWLDPEGPPVEFDAAHVQRRLADAAARARAEAGEA